MSMGVSVRMGSLNYATCNNMVIAGFFVCMRACTTLAEVWHRVVASSWREQLSASFGVWMGFTQSVGAKRGLFVQNLAN